ncbi:MULTISPECIES: GNAT family N-acetyltransferase [unclassified Psychrobacter]|uniref:GNAT family N-acetyltransferase n=1 Tax=unclassified Psychrobacter TaxID=196806 RepID=UPI00071E8F7A|nr:MULTISPECIES: GNAT family N-acetyltransferase [unclassified Psychrobacter]OLF38986.1 N-acetyltransferase [Psychrobacter sp. Cmf 22.2]
MSDKQTLDYDVINNTDKKRFEIHLDDQMALEDYEFFTTSQGEKGIEYKHTEVPKSLGGQGIAGYLVKYILDDAAAKGLRVKPTCPYVKSYIDKHSEYQDNSVFHNATP